VSTLLWTPGAAGPLDELVKRVTRMVEAFAAEHALEQAQVRLELVDGSQHQLAAISPEPGFGFFSFTPHAPAGEEPSRVVVPIGAVKVIEISPPDAEQPFGFAGSE
jgi:hypothetical protein